jgi:hypothetical protein
MGGAEIRRWERRGEEPAGCRRYRCVVEVKNERGGKGARGQESKAATAWRTDWSEIWRYRKGGACGAALHSGCERIFLSGCCAKLAAERMAGKPERLWLGFVEIVGVRWWRGRRFARSAGRVSRRHRRERLRRLLHLVRFLLLLRRRRRLRCRRRLWRRCVPRA